jgi:hypothetical protein
MEASSAKKEDFLFQVSLQCLLLWLKGKSSENTIFGSWGLNDENKISKPLNDFLPNLSRIKIPNPPPLILFPG